MNFSTWYDHGYPKIWEKLGTLKPRTQKLPQSLKVRPKNLPYNLKVRPRYPFQSTFKPFQNEILIMTFLRYFSYYIVYEKLRNFFKRIIFYQESLSYILCSELSYHFLENYMFYFRVYSTLCGLNTKEGVFFRGGGRYFYWKQINKYYIWKEKSMQLVWHLTCSTIHEIK